MINPSAIGWIDKYFIEQNPLFDTKLIDTLTFYNNIRKTGLIYGHIISINSQPVIDISTWKIDEISKVALLASLFETYSVTKKSSDIQHFISAAVAFYTEMTPKDFGFFTKIIHPTATSKLENLIDARVQTNKDVISKNFSNIVTNALLFVDVLAFQKYLIEGAIPEKYLKKIEELILNIVSLTLQVKTKKSVHDDLLLKLFEASARYTKFSEIEFQTFESLPFQYFKEDFERYYFVDLAGITLWSDGVIENEEIYFLYKLAEIMHVPDDFVKESLEKTNAFISNHKSEIQYFNNSNPVKNFYDQTSQNVATLIVRNKKRLLKELSESKELVVLLAVSTRRDLNSSEKRKVKKQLLDICKSVPSLTIFLLPGGSLLLPILVKFIPKLLPSAFNENLED